MNHSVLEKCYLFKNASADDLDAVLRIAEKKQALRGDTIFLSGSDADALFIILSGTVSTTIRDHEHAVVTVGPGQIFGDVPFFCAEKRGATAAAKEVTEYLSIAYADLNALLDKNASLSALVHRNAAAFFSRLSGRLSAELQRPFA